MVLVGPKVRNPRGVREYLVLPRGPIFSSGRGKKGPPSAKVTKFGEGVSSGWDYAVHRNIQRVALIVGMPTRLIMRGWEIRRIYGDGDAPRIRVHITGEGGLEAFPCAAVRPRLWKVSPIAQALPIGENDAIMKILVGM